MKGKIIVEFETGLDTETIQSIVEALRWQFNNAFELFTIHLDLGKE